MILSTIFVTLGGIFIFLGALGIVRMPDIFNRLQAGTKATTLGFLSIVLGVLIMRPEWWGKLVIIAAFVLLTNPIGSHNLARSAHRNREEMTLSGPDALREEEE